jgi:hypothetical protein
MISRLFSQLSNHTFAVFEAALLLHIPQCIPFHLLVCRLLLQDIDEDLVCRVGAYGVDDREAEFPFGQVFAEPFERGVARGGGEVEVVVEDLEEEAYCAD